MARDRAIRRSGGREEKKEGRGQERGRGSTTAGRLRRHQANHLARPTVTAEEDPPAGAGMGEENPTGRSRHGERRGPTGRCRKGGKNTTGRSRPGEKDPTGRSRMGREEEN